MTTNNRRNNSALALVAIAVILAGVLAPAMLNQNAFADVTRTIAHAQNAATGQALYSGGKTAYGQIFTELAIGNLQEVDCMSVSLRKSGSPTGTAYIGLIDMSDRSVDYTFGTKDVSTLSGSYVVYEFCNTGSDGLLINALTSDVFLGVKYEGGDSGGNHIDVRRSNTGAGPDYDGATSYHALWDGSEWDHFNDRDLLFKLTNTDTSLYETFCNQVDPSGNSVWVNSSSSWQNNGIGRCFPDFNFEHDGAYMKANASLSGSTLTLTTISYYYGYETPVRGFIGIAVYENSNKISTDAFTNGLGVYAPTLSSFSAGAHTVIVGDGSIADAACGTMSGVSCTVVEGEDNNVLQLTFTVS